MALHCVSASLENRPLSVEFLDFKVSMGGELRRGWSCQVHLCLGVCVRDCISREASRWQLSWGGAWWEASGEGMWLPEAMMGKLLLTERLQTCLLSLGAGHLVYGEWGTGGAGLCCTRASHVEGPKKTADISQGHQPQHCPCPVTVTSTAEPCSLVEQAPRESMVPLGHCWELTLQNLQCVTGVTDLLGDVPFMLLEDTSSLSAGLCAILASWPGRVRVPLQQTWGTPLPSPTWALHPSACPK